MRLVAMTAAVFVALLVFATNSPSASAEKSQTDKPKEQQKAKIVTVKPGDSLSKIAEENDTTYQRIYNANEKIKFPDLIYPNDKLRIPRADEKLKERIIPASSTNQISSRSYSTTKHVSYGNQQGYAMQYVASASEVSSDVWDRLAACEAGGNWAINTGNGYYGGLQFTLSSWQAVGGQGYPHQASKAEQITRGKLLQARQGWGAWPACTAKLGIR